MLIEFLFEKFPNPEDVNEAAIGDLQVIRDVKMNTSSLIVPTFLCGCCHICLFDTFIIMLVLDNFKK